MQFLYFVEGVSNAPAELIGRVGLGDVLRCPVRVGPVDRGPTGKSGVLIAAAEGPSRPLRADSGKQKWFPSGPGKKYWLGFDADSPPMAAELARLAMIGGEEVTLADGGRWIVPVARFADGQTGLPLQYGLDERTGESTAEIADTCAGLWEMAMEVIGEFARMVDPKASEANTEGGLTTQREIEIAVAAIGTNYRIGRGEALAAGLLTSESMSAVLRAMIDLDGYEQLTEADEADDVKKNSPPDG